MENYTDEIDNILKNNTSTGNITLNNINCHTCGVVTKEYLLNCKRCARGKVFLFLCACENPVGVIVLCQKCLKIMQPKY